ncbi:MAG: hypothetical protein ACNS62_01665 [Candidatus Cyclobacteriaceae bacterium M3_2C_046]
MKKLFISVCLSILVFNLMAQDNQPVAENLAYQKGDNILQAGVTFGYYGYGFAGSRSLSVPPLTGSLEFGVNEYFSVGPYVGFASWNYDWFAVGDYSYNILSLGARGSFHYLPLLNEALDTDFDLEKLDFYVSLLIGLEFQNFSSSVEGFPESYGNDTDFRFGPFVGFRYKFNPNFGVYLEGGANAFGYGTIGVSFHL